MYNCGFMQLVFHLLLQAATNLSTCTTLGGEFVEPVNSWVGSLVGRVYPICGGMGFVR